MYDIVLMPREFLSTLSLRRATHPIGVLVRVVEISIHALLAESDSSGNSCTQAVPEFLSTLSLRRATESQQPSGRPTTYFYPRSPCGERRLCTILYSCPGNFYPRSPCGERHAHLYYHSRGLNISIHALLAESDSLTVL